MSRILKPALTFDEQLALLDSRNMLIDDYGKAAKCLRRLNYYRISGYSYLFQGANDKFKKNTHFEAIIKIMEFDQEMRRLLMTFLEDIEIYARTQIAYWFSHNHEHDGGAYYDSKNFYRADFHNELIDNLNRQIEKNDRQLFIQHHIESYNGKMPLWCAVEILSFSMLSKMYKNMLDLDRETIANNMNTDESYLKNWLHCFSVLRNYCAHYARLYYVQLSPRVKLDPKTLRNYNDISQNTLFAYIVAMLRILPEDNQREAMQNGLVDIMMKYEEYIALDAIGFPDEWKQMLFDSDLISLKPISPLKRKKK